VINTTHMDINALSDQQLVLAERGGYPGRATLLRLLRRVRRLIGDSPAFLPIVLRSTPLGTSRRLRSDTVIAVEGFPRSGNTFAAFALRQLLVGASDHAVASHVHTPSQVKLAARRGIPTLLVIREPDESVCSLLVAAPHVRPASAYREWIHHHRELLPLREKFVVATLDQMSLDFRQVIRRVNDRFGELFPADRWVAGSEDSVQRAMESHHSEVHGGAVRLAPWPSEDRSSMRDLARRAIADPTLAELKAQARLLYATYSSMAG
jgi:hypothetical protein